MEKDGAPERPWGGEFITLDDPDVPSGDGNADPYVLLAPGSSRIAGPRHAAATLRENLDDAIRDWSASPDGLNFLSEIPEGAPVTYREVLECFPDEAARPHGIDRAMHYPSSEVEWVGEIVLPLHVAFLRGAALPPAPPRPIQEPVSEAPAHGPLPPLAAPASNCDVDPPASPASSPFEPGDVLMSNKVVEDFQEGESGYSTQILLVDDEGRKKGVPGPYLITVVGSDLSLPVFIGAPDTQHATTMALVIRSFGYHAAQRWLGKEPPLSEPLDEDLLLALKQQGRTGEGALAAMVAESGTGMTSDEFVEMMVEEAHTNPEVRRQLSTMTFLAALQKKYENDPDGFLRAAVNVPTYTTYERKYAEAALREHLYNKRAVDKEIARLDRDSRGGIFGRLKKRD